MQKTVTHISGHVSHQYCNNWMMSDLKITTISLVVTICIPSLSIGHSKFFILHCNQSTYFWIRCSCFIAKLWKKSLLLDSTNKNVCENGVGHQKVSDIKTLSDITTYLFNCVAQNLQLFFLSHSLVAWFLSYRKWYKVEKIFFA